MKIVAIADLHCRTNEIQVMQKIFAEINHAEADVLVLAGDLTDNGRSAEAEILAEEIHSLGCPAVAVLGNHDHEGDQVEGVLKVLEQAGVCVLDATAFELDGVGFVGTKGFCGGFGSLSVQPFGERALKTFINTSINEAVNLENAVAKLQCPHKVAILHYAPVRDTLNGEPLELYPFLGSSRLANALDRQGVDVIFHGHAHHGSPFGRTEKNIPVHNVCRFVQAAHNQNSYCVFEV
jgi:Icc-related predicted phosphoesterase